MCDWNWNTFWTAFAAIGTVGTVGSVVFLAYPVVANNKRKFLKQKKLINFFKNIENININDTKTLWIINHKKQDTKKDTLNHILKEINTLIFYKNPNIFYNEHDNIMLNEIKIEKGYHLYEIINEHCIELQMIDDASGDIKKAYIYKKNNLVSESKVEIKNTIYAEYKEMNPFYFDNIISWSKR